MLVAFGFRITKTDAELIYKICKVAYDNEVTICDLKAEEPSIKPNDIVIAFGKKASTVAKSLNPKKLINLPVIKELRPGGDDESRRRVFEVMQEIRKNKQDSNTERAVVSITSFDLENIDQTIRDIEKQGTENWKFKLKTGEIIPVTIDGEGETMTYRMLFQLKQLSVTLGAVEVSLESTIEK